MSGISLDENEDGTFAAMLLDRRVRPSNRDKVYHCMVKNRNCVERGFTVDQVKSIIEDHIEPMIRSIRDEPGRTLDLISKAHDTIEFHEEMAREFGEFEKAEFTKQNASSVAQDDSKKRAGTENGNGSVKRAKIEPSNGHQSHATASSGETAAAAANANPDTPYFERTDNVNIEELKKALFERWKDHCPNADSQEFIRDQACQFAVISSSAIPIYADAWMKNFSTTYNGLAGGNYFYKTEDEKLDTEAGIAELKGEGYTENQIQDRIAWLKSENL